MTNDKLINKLRYFIKYGQYGFHASQTKDILQFKKLLEQIEVPYICLDGDDVKDFYNLEDKEFKKYDIN